jgi:hypothetical protein
MLHPMKSRREAAMPKKIVVVALDGEPVETYEIDFNSIDNSPVTDRDFIGLAKDNMKDDNYSASDIAKATFAVRDP